MSDLVTRDKYISVIEPFIGKSIIKVITGQRRVGKSYLLRQIRDYIKQLHSDVNIIYIDKERFEYSFINVADDLVRHVETNSINGRNVLLIDEVQEIKEYERAVRHFSSKNYDIYISGSNSNILSGDLATMLSGRYIQIRVFPLDFSEFCKFHTLKAEKESLLKYLRYGGMPYLKNLDLKDEIAFDYLKNVYETILLKDVVARYSIKNVEFLDRLVLFLSDNLGSIISAKKITDFLKSQHLSISNSVVLNYLSFINNAYFVNRVCRYDLQGKRYLEIGEKYYFTDTGIRNALVGFKARDINKVLENIVYTHLISLGYEVSVGKLYDYEIDFVARKNNKLKFIQVAYLLSDESVIKREFGNLQKIKSSYSKYVVSMDDVLFDNYEGIEHIRLIDLLMNNEF